jgi:hypothetical protein
MNVRVKRTVDIAMSNYENIIGCCAFTFKGKLAYFTENMDIQDDIPMIIEIWSTSGPSLIVKGIPFVVALTSKEGLVAINPDGAVGLVCGTGKGVWFVASFIPMDADKYAILNECVQAAKSLESTVSIFEV